MRELVGEYIPETIDNYRKIPAHLRSEEYAGKTADALLVEEAHKRGMRLSGHIPRGLTVESAVKLGFDRARAGEGRRLPDRALLSARVPRR